MRTPYGMLVFAEKSGAHTIEVKKVETGKKGGVANTCGRNQVAVFYGNDDGSDDAIISAEAFNRRFKITNIIMKQQRL